MVRKESIHIINTHVWCYINININTTFAAINATQSTHSFLADCCGIFIIT